MNSKSPPTFRCAVCNCKQVGLTKLYGSWPIAGFRDLDEETQRQFWKEGGTDQASLKRSVEKFLIRRLVEASMARTAGPFLPLSVWANRGYNTEDIEQKAKKEQHPVLGTVYQVQIHETGSEKVDSLIKEHSAKMMRRVPSGAKAILPAEDDQGSADGPAGDDDQLAAADKSGDDGSDSAATSSSSSSSSHKKKKKHAKKAKKKAKKDKKNKRKEREAAKNKDKEARKAADKKAAEERKAAEKAERGRVRKIQSDAGKTLAKIATVQTMLSELLKDGKLSMVPKFAVQKGREAAKHLAAMETEARERLSSSTPPDLTFSLADVAERVKDATEAKTLLTSLLSTVRKHVE